MNCNEVRERLGLYVDGFLSDEEKKELDCHLGQCIFCKKEWTDLKVMFDKLKDASWLGIPRNFTAQVMDRVSTSNRNVIAEWFDFVFTPRVFRWNVAAVASLVILAGLSLFVLPKNRFFNSEKTINVKFQLELPGNEGVRTVSLAGDFNGWDTKTMLLSSNDGAWNIEVPLKKGRYQYMFVIDGKKWMPDPKAKKLINDGFGGKNSLLEL